MLDLTVAHARSRMQFGRPIGSFQAVKHRCADMLTRVELARTAAAHAVAAVDSADSPTGAVLLARAYCADAFAFCAGACLQVHGGIGFTWEHAAHLYLKRAKSGQYLFGQADRSRRRLAAHLGLVDVTAGR